MSFGVRRLKGVAIYANQVVCRPTQHLCKLYAVSVFPTPVGPPNKNTPRGLSELTHLLIRVVMVLKLLHDAF